MLRDNKLNFLIGRHPPPGLHPLPPRQKKVHFLIFLLLRPFTMTRHGMDSHRRRFGKGL